MNAHFELLITVLLSVGLVALIYGPWARHWTYWGRQRMFEARGELFLIAANGKMSFDDPNYRAIRGSINSMIDYAHRATWQRMLVRRLLTPPVAKDERLFAAVDRIEDPETQDQIRRMIRRLSNKVAIMILWRSPMLVLVLAVTIPPAIVVTVIEAVIDELAKKAEKNPKIAALHHYITNAAPQAFDRFVANMAEKSKKILVGGEFQDSRRRGLIAASGTICAYAVMHHVVFDAEHDIIKSTAKSNTECSA